MKTTYTMEQFFQMNLVAAEAAFRVRDLVAERISSQRSAVFSAAQAKWLGSKEAVRSNHHLFEVRRRGEQEVLYCRVTNRRLAEVRTTYVMDEVVVEYTSFIGDLGELEKK